MGDTKSCSPPSILPIPNLLLLAGLMREVTSREERECFVLRDGKFQNVHVPPSLTPLGVYSTVFLG